MANKDFYDRIADALEIIAGDDSHVNEIDKNMDYYKRIAEALENIAQGGGTAEGAGLIETTWSELKELRDNGELVPGAQYRITDYICTVANDENARVESHPYDIIVVADSESVLNENARAAMKEGDHYYHVEGQTDAVLEAWKLKYCLDNDTSRFAWADETNGKGVVYWLRDDRNNECWYDFKQIQFKRFKITAFDKIPSLVGGYTAQPANGMTIDEENPEWHFTFYGITENGEVIDNSVILINKSLVFSNITGFYCFPGNDVPKLRLCNNTFGNGCYNNTFGNGCTNNTFGNGCTNNTFGNGCGGITFGNRCSNNTFENGCYIITFGNDCANNTFKVSCYNNTFGNDCYNNTFGNGCTNNTFKNGCDNNTFEANCYNNTFGNGCIRNTFETNCYNITFKTDCCNNTFKASCYSTTFGDNCTSNTFETDCSDNTFGNNCSNNTFKNKCSHNTFEDKCRYNIFETDCSYITANQSTYHCNVMPGVQGTNKTSLALTITSNNKYTTYVGYNTANELKYWNPMDAAT